MRNVVSTDPIADMLTRIRNAIMVRKAEISLPHSRMKVAIAAILKDNHFIDNVHVSDDDQGGKTLTLRLHEAQSNPRITEITRLSKPGRRQYVRSQEIPVVKRGRGLVIVSTSKGLMTGTDAKAQGLGGELICKVY